MATIIILALFGVVLVGLEVFLPGGILGVVGIGCSVTALVMCFTVDAVTDVGLWLSFLLAGAVVVMTAVMLYFWMTYFQKTGVGKQFVLDTAIRSGRVDRSGFLGMEGETVTELRPLGKVVIGGEKWDARAESGGGMVGKGRRVKVVSASGMELVVREIEESEGAGK